MLLQYYLYNLLATLPLYLIHQRLHGSYLYAASPIDEKRAEAMEDYVRTRDEEPDWELDEHHIEHLKELGLFEEEKPGDEFISRL